MTSPFTAYSHREWQKPALLLFTQSNQAPHSLGELLSKKITEDHRGPHNPAYRHDERSAMSTLPDERLLLVVQPGPGPTRQSPE